MKTKLLSKLSSLFIAVVAIAFLFTSCDEKKDIPQSDLEGYWVLKTLNGKDAKSLFKGALPTLEFHFADSTVSGTGGCNRYSGAFTYKKGIFNAPNLAVTSMLCTEENQEPEFLLALTNKENGLSLENGLLKFTFSGTVTLEFEKGTAAEEAKPVKPSEQTLQGEWILNTIDGVDAKTRFKNSVPTISFNFAEKKVFGNDGCNSYNATFNLEGVNLAVGPIMSTRMACEGMENIAQFNQAIADSSVITLPSEKVLQFAKNGTILLEFNKVVANTDSTNIVK